MEENRKLCGRGHKSSVPLAVRRKQANDTYCALHREERQLAHAQWYENNRELIKEKRRLRYAVQKAAKSSSQVDIVPTP
jgi:hypothetical protein